MRLAAASERDRQRRAAASRSYNRDFLHPFFYR
jgi:hypothetical protein